MGQLQVDLPLRSTAAANADDAVNVRLFVSAGWSSRDVCGIGGLPTAQRPSRGLQKRSSVISNVAYASGSVACGGDPATPILNPLG